MTQMKTKMARPMSAIDANVRGRVDWVDYAKGFFVVTKLARSAKIPPAAVWLAAAALEIAPIATGSTVIDEFAGRFVFFYSGYLFAPRIFALAKEVQASPDAAFAGLLAWGLVNGLLVSGGIAELPFISLGLGLVGAGAVVAVSALIAMSGFAKALRYCGEHSIVVYLAFFLPMAASRAVLVKTGWIADVGTMSAIVTLVGVVDALALFWVVRGTALRFLFERPHRCWIAPRKRAALQPAE